MLGGLGCDFKTAVYQLCEAVRPPYGGAAPPELPRPELLQLLCVLSRSADNRLALLRWDVHTSVVRLLKALGGHMGALLAATGPQRRWEWADVEAWWAELESWLELALRMVANFVDAAFCWRAGPEARGGSTSAGAGAGGVEGSAEGHAQGRQAPSYHATSSIVQGALPALVDVLKTLHRALLVVGRPSSRPASHAPQRPSDVARALQGPFSSKRHELVDLLLMTLGGAVCCQPERQAALVSQAEGADAVRAVVGMLGWPAAQRFVTPRPLPGPLPCAHTTIQTLNRASGRRKRSAK